MKIHTFIARSVFLLVLTSSAHATTYNLPATKGDRVVEISPEETVTMTADHDQTLLDVARKFNLGQTEIVTLNPNLDRWLIKEGTVIRLPNKRILPNSPHVGITLNIAEYRMYYYPADQPGTVRSYAHGVGRQDWQTPLGRTTVAKKVKDPSWHPPESIRREHAANGDPLPEVVPPGIHNPLGAYALYLNLPGDYRIHGTDIDKIFGIGMQITHGCVRMYPEDIEALYNSVPVGTPVYIVKQPVKVGWLNNTLYIEAHPDLEGEEKTQDQRYAIALDLIQKANNGVIPDFDQVALNKAVKDLDGTPVALYEGVAPVQEEEPVIENIVKKAVEKPKKPEVAKKTVVVAAPKNAKSAKLTPSKKGASVAVASSANKKSIDTAPKKTTSQVTTVIKGKKPDPVVVSKTKVSNPVTAPAKKVTPPVKTQQTGSKGGYYHPA
jgi:L,D-transpeptidase ErfK/SrfK